MDTEQRIYDVLIVGGGPAGLAAAAVLGRAHRSVVLVDAGQQSNRSSLHTHAVFTRDCMPPEELYSEAQAQLRRYPTVELVSATVSELVAEDYFEASLDSGRSITAKYLLLAQGVKFSHPAIPGIVELWGREVWHCPYCHGFEVSGKRLLAIGDEIWLNGMKELLPVWTDKITWAPTADVSEIRCAGHGERGIVAVICGSETAFDQCIVQTTVTPRDGLADGLGCARNEKGQLAIDANGLTSLERVYSAGDQTPAGGQVNLAVAAGHQASIAINEALGLPKRPQTS